MDRFQAHRKTKRQRSTYLAQLSLLLPSPRSESSHVLPSYRNKLMKRAMPAPSGGSLSGTHEASNAPQHLLSPGCCLFFSPFSRSESSHGYVRPACLGWIAHRHARETVPSTQSSCLNCLVSLVKTRMSQACPYQWIAYRHTERQKGRTAPS